MGKIIGIYRSVVQGTLIFTTGVMIAVVAAQVIWRYLLNDPLQWSEEVARICLIVITFLGSALAVQRNAHFRVDVLTRKLPPSLYGYAEALLSIVAALYMCVVVYGSIFMMQNVNMGIISALGIPAKTIYLVFPIGGGLVIINLLDNAWKSLRGEGGTEF